MEFAFWKKRHAEAALVIGDVTTNSKVIEQIGAYRQ
jgi:hypothetical protein